MKKYLLIVFTILLVFLFNNQLLVTDSVEANYALTAKEMYLANDWLSPQIYGQYWFDKPIFFYWLIMLSYKIFGFTEFAARLPSSIMGCLSIVFAFWYGSRLYSKETGFYGAFVLLSSFSFFLITKSIITDATLFLFFNATLGFFFIAYTGNKNFYICSYFFSALATITKGPIGFLLPGLIILVFLLLEKNLKELKFMRIFSGLLVFAIIALPWYTFMYHKHGMSFINIFFGTHNFLRATLSEHPKDNVFYYYTLILFLGFFPWFTYAFISLKEHYLKSQKFFAFDSKEKFLLLWAIIPFVFFQLIATKYITYTYPILFPLSLLVAIFFLKNKALIFNNFSIYTNNIFILSLIAAVYLAYYLNFLPIKALYLPLAYFSVHIVLSKYFYLRKIATSFFIYTAISSCVFYLILLYTTVIPLTELKSAKELASYIATQKNTHITSYGEYPTSAIFYSNSLISKLSKKEDIVNNKPVAYSWKSKNVMPFAALENLQNGDLVLVSQKSYNDFQKDFAYKKIKVFQSTHWLIFQINKV